MLLATLFTFVVIYVLIILLDIDLSSSSYQKRITNDIQYKLALYACFIPVLVYTWCLFGKTEQSFNKIFMDIIEARKHNLGQVVNRYND